MGEEEQRGAELGGDVTDEEAGAADDGLADIGERDAGVVEEEVEDGVEAEVGVGGEELRVHIEDAAHGGALDAHGGEAVLDGDDGGEGAGAEVGVFEEGFLGIYVEVGFEVDELFAEEEAGVGGGVEGEGGVVWGIENWGEGVGVGFGGEGGFRRWG